MRLPRPEGNQETEPGERENPTIQIDRIQTRDRTSLSIDRIDLWSPPE